MHNAGTLNGDANVDTVGAHGAGNIINDAEVRWAVPKEKKEAPRAIAGAGAAHMVRAAGCRGERRPVPKREVKIGPIVTTTAAGFLVGS